MPAYPDDDARWQALATRDPAADGAFVYAVRTTGIYAQPSACLRLPKRENVLFFSSAAQAQAAGFRPRRDAGANPAARSAQRARLIAQACRAIEAADTPLALETLAAQADMSPFHFHRVFKAETGLTPKAYADAARARRLRDRLADKQQDGTLTQAVYDAGFNSSSRFYEKSGRLLGMRPASYRAGGERTCIHFAVGQCSLGAILVAQSEYGVCAISLGDDPDTLLRDLQDQFPRAQLVGGDAQFEQLVAQVVGFVEAPAIGLNLPLDIRGTAFQERVWRALRDVPAGQRISYRELAERIGSPTAVRAVANACAANPIAVAIPCHRVIRQDGLSSGYRWGVARKQALLQREATTGKHTIGKH